MRISNIGKNANPKEKNKFVVIIVDDLTCNSCDVIIADFTLEFLEDLLNT